MNNQSILKTMLTLLWCVCVLSVCQAQTWDEWFRQKKTQRKYLLQQIVKLQVYLGYAKKGYNIAREGLTTINTIKKGDFNLHYIFLDRLKKVNPAIKQYAKVAAIIDMQLKMLTAYKRYMKQFRQSGVFSSAEIQYFYELLTSLLAKVMDDMEQLTDLLTDGILEMNDSERIKRIDKLHISVSEKYSFLFSFADRIKLAGQQRQKELRDLQTLQKNYEP